MTEKQLHKAVCRYISLQYPEVMFVSEPGGVRVTPGIARKIAKLRSDVGLPDLYILEPSQGYHGLILELKKSVSEYRTIKGDIRDTKHIQVQNKILKKLRRRNYFASFAGGFEEAQNIIDWYLKPEK